MRGFKVEVKVKVGQEVCSSDFNVRNIVTLV